MFLLFFSVRKILRKCVLDRGPGTTDSIRTQTANN